VRTRSATLSLLLALAVLTGCTDDTPTDSSTVPASPSSSSPSPAPTSSAAASGATYIDTGGTQVLGLAVRDGAVWAVSYDTSMLAKIDPATNTVVATVNVPGGASAASLPSGLWVAAYGNPGHLYRIDPDLAKIALTMDVGDLCCDLTEGAGLVWALDRSGAAIGVDPESGAVSRTLPVELDLNAHNNVVFAGGYLWVSSDTTALFRLDPSTGRTTSFDVGGGVPFLVVGGLLWGASPTELWAVDPATGEVVERVEIVDSIEVMALAIEGRTAWVGMRHPGQVGAVLELDLRDGTVRSELPVDIPARIELALGSRWISDSGSSMVLRVGP
jgi:streptogramin lyase